MAFGMPVRYAGGRPAFVALVEKRRCVEQRLFFFCVGFEVGVPPHDSGKVCYEFRTEHTISVSTRKCQARIPAATGGPHHVRVPKLLAELKAQRSLLDRAITALESTLKPASAGTPRGSRRRGYTSRPQSRSRRRIERRVRRPHRGALGKVIPFHVPGHHVRRSAPPRNAYKVITLKCR